MERTNRSVLRNTVISGLLIFLFIAVLYLANDDSKPKNMDNLNSTRAMLLLLTGFVLPGLFFGLAVARATMSRIAEKWKLVLYVVLVSALYIGLVLSSISTAKNLIYASGAGALFTLLLTHFLIGKLKYLPIILVAGLAAGLLILFPFWWMQSTDTELLKDESLGILSFLLFPAWHAAIGVLIAYSLTFPSEDENQVDLES